MNKFFKISLIGYISISFTLLFINVLTSPSIMWSFIPSALLLWWPLGALYAETKKGKLLSVLGTLLNIGFLVGLNLAFTPGYPWFLFVAGPMLWWPIAMFAGEKAKTRTFAWCSYVILVSYYGAINLWVEPRHLFTVYIAYALIWWPISVTRRNKINRKALSVLGAVANMAFMFSMNQLVKPEYFWSIFVFAPLLWWPICEFAGQKAKTVGFAWFSFIALGGYYGLVNYFIETRHPFILYILFALAWWPLGIALSKHKNVRRFSVEGALLLAMFFGIVNWITTPSVVWAIYPISVTMLWPICVLIFVRRKPAPVSRR